MKEKRPFVGVWVFVVKNWKFLLWKRKSNHENLTWSIPGWHLEFWETFEECWVRETLEEAWVYIKDVELFWITNNIWNEKHYVTIFLKSKYESGEPHVTDFDEFYEWRWVDLEELPEKLFPIFKEFLEKNLEEINKLLIK
jgi:8-oxo-dGTP diphosphatase